MRTQTEVTEKRVRSLVLAVLCFAVAFSVLRAVTAAPKPKTAAIERVTLPEGRRQVRMMDDVYKTAVVATHQMYVQDPGTPAAVIWAKQVINKLKGKGWPDARIFATHDRPLNPENAPVDGFERNAAAAFKKGNVSYEEVAPGELRYATDLRILDEKCVMCHVRSKPGDLVGGVSYRVPLVSAKK
jgi:hypothetical protein